MDANAQPEPGAALTGFEGVAAASTQQCLGGRGTTPITAH